MHSKIIDFSKFSSLKIGNSHEVFVIDEICDCDYFFIIGGANNLLVSPNPPKLAVLSKKFDYILLDKNTLKIGGATPSGKILSFCKKHDINGFEFLGKLPGTLGGMLKMNAGVKEWEIFENLVEIASSKGVIKKSEIDFGYRYAHIDGVIFEATFESKKGFDTSLVEMFASMRANQPQLPSAGSCFKNPPKDYAGRLIEEVGLKGKQIGGVAFSEKHANFLVNLGNATFEDAITLIELAKKLVFEKFGVTLEEEIKIV